jgi:NitT/TauT family transport system permease protein
MKVSVLSSAPSAAEKSGRSFRSALAAAVRAHPERPLSVLLFFLFLAIWEGTVVLFDIPPIVFPSASSVIRSLIEGIASGILLKHTLITFGEVMAGFAVGSLTGLLLGVLIGQFYMLEKTLYPYIVAFQAIPKIAIAPVFVIWFGFGMSSKVVISATIAFFPLLANTIAGLRASPADQIELLSAFTASRWQIFRMVKLPQALPYVFVGLDLAIVLSVIGAIAGEFVGARAGLGYLIMQRNFTMNMAGVFAVLVVLSLMGVGLHLIVNAIERRVVFWIRRGHEGISGA